MRAEYDSQADALAIDLIAHPTAASGEGIDDRCTVALDAQGRAVSVELLDPGDCLEASLAAAAEDTVSTLRR